MRFDLLLRLADLLHVTVWYFGDVGVRVAPRCELLRYCLLCEFHVDATGMILDLISQTLPTALHRANVPYLELAEPDSGIEIEALRPGPDHMLRTLHLPVNIAYAILLHPEGVLEAAVVEVALRYGFRVGLLPRAGAAHHRVLILMEIEMAACVRYIEVLLVRALHRALLVFLIVTALEVAHRARHGRKHG